MRFTRIDRVSEERSHVFVAPMLGDKKQNTHRIVDVCFHFNQPPKKQKKQTSPTSITSTSPVIPVKTGIP
jgi:hypothetical protein